MLFSFSPEQRPGWLRRLVHIALRHTNYLVQYFGALYLLRVLFIPLSGISTSGARDLSASQLSFRGQLLPASDIPTKIRF